MAAVLAVAALCLAAPPPGNAERIRELVSLQGVRDNPLLGYGVVVGLDGTGDQTTQTPFTVQTLSNMLNELGISAPPSSSLQLKNVAAVMVTAVLPPFARQGQTIDVTVSSLGNAKSLRGGTLLMTPLKGADGNVYAMAQGNLLVGGVGASANGSKVTVNHLSAGRVPAGATVERAVPMPVGQGEFLQFDLNFTDFTTARRIEQAINSRYPGAAQALDGRLVRVRAPEPPGERVAFISGIEALEVQPAQAPAKVIINARTGSVVMNRTVTVDTCAVAHGNLSVVIRTEPVISQPGAFSSGTTVATQRSDIQINQDAGQLVVIPAGISLDEVVKALNAVGATPGDLLAILQAMKAAGALRAELEVI